MRRGSLLAGTLAIALGITPAATVASSAGAADPSGPELRVAAASFSYTGTTQTYTVPSGTRVLKVIALGGGGASGPTVAAGGSGAVVTTYQAVQPGQLLSVKVGGGGAAASTGGAARP